MADTGIAFTEGPWLENDEWVRDPRDLLTSTNDARLIGSAPDLYAACKSLLETVETHISEYEEVAPLRASAPIFDVMRRDCLNARAAIAKAEGRKPCVIV